jgi:hypothetical protein
MKKLYFTLTIIKCSHPNDFYRTTPMSKDVMEESKKVFAKAPLNEVIGFKMEKTGGSIVYFSRHDISQFYFTEMEIEVPEGSAVAPESE